MTDNTESRAIRKTVPMSARVGVAVLGLCAPIAVIVTRLITAGRTPDPVPTHWSLSGQVNGTMSAGGNFLFTLAITAVLAILVLVAMFGHVAPWSGKVAAAGMVGVGTMFASIYLSTTTLSIGAAKAQDVSLPPWMIVVNLVVGLGFAALVWLILPVVRPKPASAPVTPIALGPTERATWIGTARASGLIWAAMGVGILAVAAVFIHVVAGLALLLVALLVAVFGEVAVRVDDRGLHVLWGPVGFPRRTIPLDAIASVRVEQIEPMQWGGWGLRVSSRGTAAIVRRGPGIVITRPNGSAFAVTVDDAENGGAVLAALAARATSTQ